MPQVQIKTGTRGVQVFRGETDAELIAQLQKAQQHSTEHIINLHKELRLCKRELFKCSVVLSKISAAIASGNGNALTAALHEVAKLTSDWKETA